MTSSLPAGAAFVFLLPALNGEGDSERESVGRNEKPIDGAAQDASGQEPSLASQGATLQGAGSLERNEGDGRSHPERE